MVLWVLGEWVSASVIASNQARAFLLSKSKPSWLVVTEVGAKVGGCPRGRAGLDDLKEDLYVSALKVPATPHVFYVTP